MLWVSLAAQIAIAQPIAPILSSDDFPTYLQQADASRYQLIQITVAADGTVTGCDTALGSGDPTLDRYTCILVMKRGRFAPARGVDGTPIVGIVRQPVSWAANATSTNVWTHGDLDLTVNQLPKGVSSPHFEAPAIDVDPTGRIAACEGNRRSKTPELTRIACDTVMKAYDAPIAKDGKGAPVESVQNVLVRFNK